MTKAPFFLKVVFFSLGLSILLTFFRQNGYADTVYLKDKSTIKGIMLEDYIDRIVYSTLSGEKEILKSEIRKVEYDEPIDNLMNLGDSFFKKGDYKAALKYYLMAQEIKPDIDTLNNKIYHTETIIYKAPEIQRREHVRLKNEIISGRINLPTSPPTKVTAKEALEKEFRINLSRKKHGRFYIDNLASDSPFKKAGALKDDALIAIWSKLCDYLTFEDLYNSFSNPSESMIALTLERRLNVQGGLPVGAEFIMKWEGAVVNNVSEGGAFKKAGIKNGDLIIAIGDRPIRYVPLRRVQRWLKERGPQTDITIQRKLTVFK